MILNNMCIPRKGLKRLLLSLLNYEKTIDIFVSRWERLSAEFVVDKGVREISLASMKMGTQLGP
jgi:hypothetical protein